MPYIRTYVPDTQTQEIIEYQKYSVDNPPGTIEERVFIAGRYTLMPILREIEDTVFSIGFQPIIAYDFDIPRDKTRDYTLRLLSCCRYSIFEMTLGNGHLVEYVVGNRLTDTRILQLYMAMDENKEKPPTVSSMVWQINPPPQGYCTISEMKEIIGSFLVQYATTHR